MGCISIHFSTTDPGTCVKRSLDRLAQMELRVNFADNAVVYNGKIHGYPQRARELVCIRALPSQPVSRSEKAPIECVEQTYAMIHVCFWRANGEKLYNTSFFEGFPGVWAHGDFVHANPQTGGLVILGRLDGVLNSSGVRFCSAEIYSLILQLFPSQVEESLCIRRRHYGDTDETVVLFNKTSNGQPFNVQFDETVRHAMRDGAVSATRPWHH